MACNRIFAGKLCRNDAYHIMPPAFACAGMSSVFVALVDDFQLNRFKHGKPDAHFRYAFIHCGKVFLKVCTRTPAYTPAFM